MKKGKVYENDFSKKRCFAKEVLTRKEKCAIIHLTIRLNVKYERRSNGHTKHDARPR